APGVKDRRAVTTVKTRSDHVFRFARNGLPLGVFMATPTRKGSKNTKTKPRRAVVKTSHDKQAQPNAELRQQLAQSLQREQATAKELREALEQKSATSDILWVISSAPTDLQPVLNTTAEHSVALCGALFGWVYRFDGELIHRVAPHNSPPVALENAARLFP